MFAFDESLLKISISLRQLNEISTEIVSQGQITEFNEEVWALKALTLIDLTTLAGDDTVSNVRRLCQKAICPVAYPTLNEFVASDLKSAVHTASVCVYPARVSDAYDALTELEKNDIVCITAVATGFPTGQYSLESRLKEIIYAVNKGAKEIDIVINRQLALHGDWKGIYNEVCEMRKTCGDGIVLKAILAAGELGSMENIYKASMTCMLAGADFIKTSTGKESVNATIPIGLVMINAIKTFYKTTGRLVGLKPAGGVRTVTEAIKWLILVKETLGNEYLHPRLFRFGASGLLDDIENLLRKRLCGKSINNHDAIY